MPLDYYVWVIANDLRTILVDTGFDALAAQARKRTLLRTVEEGLAALGIKPASIEDVVITHMHYDHAGNLGLFPGARFHVQDAELAYCTGRAMTHQHIAAPFEARDVMEMVRRVFDGRVVFHSGTSELCPGITLHHLGGHTAGLQAVRVETARGDVVLASDSAHFWANLDRETPFPIVANVTEYLEAYRTLRRIAPSRSHIIPGHDPLVLQCFPCEEGTEDIARLDRNPLREIPRA